MNRYNPHHLQNHCPEWSKSPVGLSLPEDCLHRAFSVWVDGVPSQVSPEVTVVGIGPDLRQEYGIDATRLNCLVSPDHASDEALFEGHWRWLAKVYHQITGLEKSSRTWTPGIWLAAAGQMQDYLFKERKPEVALAALRKAWNEAPLSPKLPRNGLLLGILLLEPFAPILGRFLLEEILALKSTIPPLNKLLESFSDVQGICVTIERGGRHWLWVDRKRWDEAPARALSRYQWFQSLQKFGDWEIQRMDDTWNLHRRQPRENNGKPQS